MTKVILPKQTRTGLTVSILEKLLDPLFSQRQLNDKACAGMFALVNRSGDRITFKCRDKNGTHILGHFTKGDNAEALDNARTKRAALKLEQMAETIPDLIIGGNQLFSETCEDFYNNYVVKQVERPDKFRSLLNCHIIPALGKHPTRRLKTANFAQLIRSISERGTPAAAESVHMCLKRIDTYCLSNSIYDMPLTYGLDKKMLGAFSGTRTRTLDFDTVRGEPDFKHNELKQLFNIIDYQSPRMSQQVKAGIKFLVFTPIRSGELLDARWVDYDERNGELVILKESKNFDLVADKNSHGNKGHKWMVPLSTQAQTILKKLKLLSQSEWIIGGGVAGESNDTRPTDATIRQGLSRLQKRKNKAGNPLFNAPEPITPHDFRRTFSSHAQWAGIDEDIAHACENHGQGKGKINQTYNHNKKLEQRREALQKWADYVIQHVNNDIKDMVKHYG